MARLLCLLCCTLIALPAWSKRARPERTDEVAAGADAAPTAPDRIAAAAAALGGAEGGHRALAALPGYRMTFRMEINDPYAGKRYTADHVYERGLDGSLKLTVTMVDGEGVDSVAFVDADGGWIEADGQRGEFAADEVRARVDDFSPERLFQVPLELASQGIESLPAEVRDRLALEAPADAPADEDATADGDAAADPDGPGDDDGEVIVALDDAGVEQLRLVLEPEQLYPVEAAFASVAGRITYRFSDFREVSPGLIVPHQRTFVRNGVLLSELSVTSFEVLGGSPSGGPEKGR